MKIVDKLYEDFDDCLPISVIVPMSEKRNFFFHNFVYPLLEANRPAEIIVNSDHGTAPKKRNEGFKLSKQPYVFFCDDDIVMPKGYLKKLYDLLEKNPDKAYAYTGYYGIVMHPHTHPLKNNFQIPSIPFNGERLKQGNYISTMSLIRREAFPGFDESLKRLQDWDLFLTMLEKGQEGIMLDGVENMYHAYYLDEGITSNSNNEREALMTVIQKHKLM